VELEVYTLYYILYFANEWRFAQNGRSCQSRYVIEMLQTRKHLKSVWTIQRIALQATEILTSASDQSPGNVHRDMGITETCYIFKRETAQQDIKV
jgi:hypothetical protein